MFGALVLQHLVYICVWAMQKIPRYTTLMWSARKGGRSERARCKWWLVITIYTLFTYRVWLEACLQRTCVFAPNCCSQETAPPKETMGTLRCLLQILEGNSPNREDVMQPICNGEPCGKPKTDSWTTWIWGCEMMGWWVNSADYGVVYTCLHLFRFVHDVNMPI